MGVSAGSYSSDKFCCLKGKTVLDFRYIYIYIGYIGINSLAAGTDSRDRAVGGWGGYETWALNKEQEARHFWMLIARTHYPNPKLTAWTAERRDGGGIKGEGVSKITIKGPLSVVFIRAVNKHGGVKTFLPSCSLLLRSPPFACACDTKLKHKDQGRRVKTGVYLFSDVWGLRCFTELFNCSLPQ